MAERQVEPPMVTAERLAFLRESGIIPKDATMAHVQLWAYDCARQGVGILDRLIHCTIRRGRYVPITSIEFLRTRAADSGQMAGSDDAVFVERSDNQPPLKATVTVYRLTEGLRFAYTGTARWSEYKPDEDFMWRRMPYTMLAKCAEALALRKGFPKQLSGLYIAEEMEQADNRERRPDAATPPVPQASPSVPGLSITGASTDGGSPTPTGDETAVVDQETGEELVPPPDFHFVCDYQLTTTGWHEATLLNYDGQGGAMRVSTTGDVGARLKEAQDQRIPVKVQLNPKRHTKGEAYLVDKFGVRFYDPSLEDIPF